jgi:hypothetical protein
MCEVYETTPELAVHGTHVVSTDEMTGSQTLEQFHPCLPMLPDHVERVEFENLRHDTQSVIADLDMTTGQVIAPALDPGTLTRTSPPTLPDYPDRLESLLVLCYRSTQYPLIRSTGALGGREV